MSVPVQARRQWYDPYFHNLVFSGVKDVPTSEIRLVQSPATINSSSARSLSTNALRYGGKIWAAKATNTDLHLLWWDDVTGAQEIRTVTSSMSAGSYGYTVLMVLDGDILIFSYYNLQCSVFRYDITLDSLTQVGSVGSSSTAYPVFAALPYKSGDIIHWYVCSMVNTTSGAGYIQDFTFNVLTDAVGTVTVYAGSGGSSASSGTHDAFGGVDYTVNPPVLHVRLASWYATRRPYIRVELGASSPSFTVNTTFDPIYGTFLGTSQFLSAVGFRHRGAGYNGKLYVPIYDSVTRELSVKPLEDDGTLGAPIGVKTLPAETVRPDLTTHQVPVSINSIHLVDDGVTPPFIKTFLNWYSTEDWRISVDRSLGHGNGITQEIFEFETPATLAQASLSANATFVAEVRRLGETFMQAQVSAASNATLRYHLSSSMESKARVITYLPTKPAPSLYPNIILGRAKANEWIYHDKLRVPLLNRVLTTGAGTNMEACARSGGGLYLAVFTNGDMGGGAVPALHENPTVAIAEVVDSDNINWLTSTNLPSNFSTAPYSANHYHNRMAEANVIEFNGGLYVSYMWIDKGETRFWRIGFNVDRYDLTTHLWSNVVRETDLFSGADYEGGGSTYCLGDANSNNYWSGVLTPVLYNSKIYYLAQYGCDQPPTALQSNSYWPGWRVFSVDASHVVTEETNRPADSLFSYLTYVNNPGGSQLDSDSYMWVAPRRARGFLASDGKPAWLWHNWAGRFWGVLRADGVGDNQLLRDHHTPPNPDLLVRGTPNRSVGNLLPFQTSAGRIGVLENSPDVTRGYLRAYDYVAGSSMDARFTQVPGGVYSGSYPMRAPIGAPRAMISSRMLIPDLDYTLNVDAPDVSGMQVQLLNDPRNVFQPIKSYPTNAALYENGDYFMFDLHTAVSTESELTLMVTRLSVDGDRIVIPKSTVGRTP